MEQAKDGAVVSGVIAESILAGLDELFTPSGQGLVAFDEAGMVVFSTRLANDVLDIRDARISAQIIAVKDSRPLTFSELPFKEPELVLVKNASGERPMQIFRVQNQRLFLLRDAERPADQSLIDILAHDLRGGMVPAKTYAQMLLTSVFGALSEKQLEAARVIDASLQKQEDRIANVLDMVKASENRLEVSLETVSLIDVVRQSSAAIERDARRKSVKVVLELDESAALIQADAKRLQRLLINLLNRSLKHSAQGQSIGIELSYPSQSACRLRVWDVGTGSSAADLEVLQSKSNQRVQSKPVDKHAANFDIAAVYDIVFAHGGDLKVQTEAGAGTTYRLNFPVQRRASAQSTSGKPRAILIAGADAAERALLEGAAKKKDIEAVFAENGKEAIKHSRARHYPLMILNERFADCDLSAVMGAIRFQRPEDPQVLCIIRHDGQAVNDSSVQNWRGSPDTDAASAELVLSEMLQKL